MRARSFAPGKLAPVALLALAHSGVAHAEAPNGVALVRELHSHADLALGTGVAGAAGLVRLPPGTAASTWGLDAVGPGVGATRGGALGVLRFGLAHPRQHVEVAPPLHLLLDRVGQTVRAPIARASGADGAGTLIGVADTGIDVTHKDLQAADGSTRIAWLLDLSLKPIGLFPDLEQRFGVRDESGTLVAGAVLDGAALDELIRRGRRTPTDELGHGTHVTSIAAGNGGGTPFAGVAPRAGIVFARVVRSGAETIANDDLLRGVDFMFDRADALKKPIAVNLSVGTDFGPHDGSSLWEQQLASYVGAGKPGRALVVAAGNSGSVRDTPVHQSVFVAPTSRTRVPFVALGGSGNLQIWVSARPGATVQVGLDGPDREWISPVAFGATGGLPASDGGAALGYDAAVIHGDSDREDVIPAGSRSAVVVISGAPPKGTYHVTLVGEGAVDLWYQGSGASGGGAAGFPDGVREGTINLPAAHPDILAVGCTVNRASWTAITGGNVSLNAPTLDLLGRPVPGAPGRRAIQGEPCWFSSAGPNLNGVAKPEIAAPGGGVVGAMAKQAGATTPGSIFYDPTCPKPCADGNCKPDTRCRQIDESHAVALGTSMSAPVVAGAIALLFQRDPTLTQHEVVSLLQAGAHPFTGPAPFGDQSGPGEVDIPGALDALEHSRTPVERLPVLGGSWITLSTPYAPADGELPVVAIVELRTADGRPADVFDRTRVRAQVSVAGVPLEPPPSIERKQPGLWTYRVVAPKGSGGRSMRLSATFDGVDIVAAKVLPIAADSWSVGLAPRLLGGRCAVGRSPGGPPAGGTGSLVLVGLAAVLGITRARGRRFQP